MSKLFFSIQRKCMMLTDCKIWYILKNSVRHSGVFDKYMYVCRYVCMYTCMYYIYKYICVCIHTHTHTHTPHIHTHIYIYIYTLNKIITQHFCFCPPFFMSWTQRSKTFCMYTQKTHFYQICVHKSVWICVSEHFSFVEIIPPPHRCGICSCNQDAD